MRRGASIGDTGVYRLVCIQTMCSSTDFLGFSRCFDELTQGVQQFVAVEERFSPIVQ